MKPTRYTNLFLVHLSISTCFGRLCAHHQEKQLCFCDTWDLLFCVEHTRQSSTQNNRYQVSQKHSCFSRWWAHSHPKHVEIDTYTKNKSVHLVGFIYKIIQRCTVNKTLKKLRLPNLVVKNKSSLDRLNFGSKFCRAKPIASSFR